jgi:hypothetical protein
MLSAFIIFFGNFADADTPPLQDAPRGELLYSTHCVACHTTEMHWRDKKRVSDWRSLQSEVMHWQQICDLKWDDADVVEVGQYLNSLY